MAAATVLGIVVAACAARGPGAGEADATTASRASAVAAAIAAADAALASGDPQALAASLQRLEGRAHPLDPATPDLVARLRDATHAPHTPMRGRALGPGYAHGTLDPGGDVSLHQLFLSGQAATIAAESSPRHDMRMRIRDAGGAVVCERDPAHADDCRFTPLYTQRYRIELSNHGATSARYYLVVD